MATTTNYSWTTPDDTALVKDGAAAIRSLGTAIDTTVFTNAGAAIAKSIVDAKGDLIAGTADNTVARLAVGTNGHTLVADSSTATGLKWAAPASSSFPAFLVNRATTTQTANTGTQTKVAFNNETFDTDNCFDSTTNNRFTPNKAGYYQFNANVLVNGSPADVEIILRKNGSNVTLGNYMALTSNAYANMVISCVAEANGTTDYFEIFIQPYGNNVTINTGVGTSFSGIGIRSL